MMQLAMSLSIVTLMLPLNEPANTKPSLLLGVAKNITSMVQVLLYQCFNQGTFLSLDATRIHTHFLVVHFTVSIIFHVFFDNTIPSLPTTPFIL